VGNFLIFVFSFLNQLLGKSLRVDHVQNYKPPKDDDRYDDVTRKLHEEGCAPKDQIPEAFIKREDERRIKREEEKPMRKRSPVRKISPDLKRVKRERSEEEDRVSFSQI
jgi:RNA-binding motif X-linked protein 2